MKQNFEQNLVQRAIAGETEAVAELFRRYWRAARATAYGITANLDLAEDAAAEAFCAAFENLRNLKDLQRFGPWLHTIVMRTATRHKKKNPTSPNVDSGSLPDSRSLSPDERSEQREFAALLHEAIGSLPGLLREAICLFYFEGYTIEGAAHFLDIPTGTFKRRLHDGRRCLRYAVEQISNGIKPIDIEREQILRQFDQLIEKGSKAGDTREIFRKILRLRPLPYERMAAFLQQHSKIAQKMATSKGCAEIEERARHIMEYICRPSPHMLDPNHAVGKAMQAVRDALPQFRKWQPDTALAAQSLTGRFVGNLTTACQPPGFAEGIPGAYLYTSKALLVQNPDGTFSSPYEYLQKDDAARKKHDTTEPKQMISDVLILTWMRSDAIALRDVETLLRELAKTLVPEIPVRFSAFEEPYYRSALQMQLADIPLPAAIGGPANPWANMPEHVSAANIKIFLESWAAAQSGTTVELTEMASLLKTAQNPNRSSEEREIF